MLILSRFCLVACVAFLVVAAPPQAVPQEAKKTPTLAEEKLALLGDWKMVVSKDGDSVVAKLRFTDRELRLLIFSQSSTSFNIGGPNFDYHLTEKKGQRFVVLSAINRDETLKIVKYQLDGDKLRLMGAGVTLNNRQYDMTGEWTRWKKKK